MSDQELSKKFETYQQLAKENPNVDINLLMSSALANEDAKAKTGKSYRWPYLIALGVPPLGLVFAVKYYLSGEEDDKNAANICVALTVISLLLFFALGKIMFSSSGTSLQQVEQIKPSDAIQLLQ